MNMEDLIDGFPDQLKEALEIASKKEFQRSNEEVAQVLISGMGGSGIGGTLVSEWVDKECRVPVTLNKDYHLPAWVGRTTLLIVSSYSGNTEESLSALEEGVLRDAHIVCISSGGELERIAREKGLDHIKVPAGYPPRAAMGYSIVQILRILSAHELLVPHFDIEREIQASAKLLELDRQVIKDKARELAEELHGKRPVIYAGSGQEGVAVRWRQQFNENAKTLCWHHVLPEMNHNELVGWEGSSKDIAVLLLRNEDDPSRVQKRMELCRELLEERTALWRELVSRGETRIQKALYHIHLGDQLSYQLALKNEVDPMEVDIIEELKKRLKESSGASSS
jgi:glucose/mannose-6-phosphate isomerase